MTELLGGGEANYILIVKQMAFFTRLGSGAVQIV